MDGNVAAKAPEVLLPFVAAQVPEALQGLYPFIEGAGVALVIFILGWMVSKTCNRLTQRLLKKSGKVDVALGRFLGSIVQYGVLAATVIAALGQVGIETTSLVAVFASAGLAIGLALQGSLSNFASGVMLLLFRPFDLNDVITAGGKTAKVTDIGIFATTLKSAANDRIIMPNSKVLGDTIVNHTVEGTRRASIDASVAYGADLKAVQEILLESARSAELTLAEPDPAVAFVEMAASSINFQVHVFANADDYLGMVHNVRSEIYDRLNAAGVEIPFNQIVLHQDAS